MTMSSGMMLKRAISRHMTFHRRGRFRTASAKSSFPAKRRAVRPKTATAPTLSFVNEATNRTRPKLKLTNFCSIHAFIWLRQILAG